MEAIELHRRACVEMLDCAAMSPARSSDCDDSACQSAVDQKQSEEQGESKSVGVEKRRQSDKWRWMQQRHTARMLQTCAESGLT